MGPWRRSRRTRFEAEQPHLVPPACWSYRPWFPGRQSRSTTQSGAILFRLVNRRVGRASTVLTSNKRFEDWGHILAEEVVAVALRDRCRFVNTRGSSYQMRRHADSRRPFTR